MLAPGTTPRRLLAHPDQRLVDAANAERWIEESETDRRVLEQRPASTMVAAAPEGEIAEGV